VSHDLRLERVLDAPPEAVFDAFVDPAARHDPYADAPDWVVESECDLRVGGRWTIAFGPPGREPARETNVFEQIERPRPLVYRSTMVLPSGSSVDTHMRVTFERDDNKTRMTLVQSGFPTAQLPDEFRSGSASILDGLERVMPKHAEYVRVLALHTARRSTPSPKLRKLIPSPARAASRAPNALTTNGRPLKVALPCSAIYRLARVGCPMRAISPAPIV
jgi:uncharacterized protein YndB with AHSA1/START domain